MLNKVKHLLEADQDNSVYSVLPLRRFFTNTREGVEKE
jgi:hypothetical protein